MAKGEGLPRDIHVEGFGAAICHMGDRGYRSAAPGGAPVSSGPYTEEPPSTPMHRPVRPSWHCSRGCGPWPCGLARASLTAEYAEDPAELSIRMSSDLHGAIKDLWQLHPDGPPGVTLEILWERFVEWTRPTVLGVVVVDE